MTRYITKLLLGAVILISAVGCDAFRIISSGKVNTQGAPYELIVVCNQPEWEGALGDSLRAVLSASIPAMQQDEPFYDVVRITHRNYTNIVVRHRNILRCIVSPEADSTWVAVQYDVNAAPQIILTLQGPTANDMARYVGENGNAIVAAIENAERDRDMAYARKYNQATLSTLIYDTFGFKMNIPPGYTLRNKTEDFIWISHEYPLASQGIVISKREAKNGLADLMLGELVSARNGVVAQIPGPSEGSYMSTYLEYEPDYRTYRINGRLWAELQGFWRVEGDFMGGPFVSFSTIDERTNEVITIDCYVYSPKDPKRNLKRGLEHLLFGVSFETETAEEGK